MYIFWAPLFSDPKFEHALANYRYTNGGDRMRKSKSRATKRRTAKLERDTRPPI